MAFSSFLSTLAAICLALLPTLLFLPKSSFDPSFSLPHQIPQRSLLSQSQTPNNETILTCSSLPPSNGLLNYLSLHFCLLKENLFLSIPLLFLFVLLFFYFLVETAQSHFSIVTTKLTQQLNLSPSMGGVTLLALGNGAPDVFASLAAVRSGQYRTGFGAILSAGTFVSALVVGFVAIYAAPFSVDPGSFVRDVAFYLIGAMMLFYVYLSGEISFWQAIGFVGFYVFFVMFVFWMDLGRRVSGFDSGGNLRDLEEVDCEKRVVVVVQGEKKTRSGWFGVAYGKISKLWELPVSVLLKMTIPQTAPTEWNRFYISANIILCPLALLCACNSFVPLDHPISFLLPNTPVPLWFVVLLTSSSLALLHYVVEKEPPKTEQIPVALVAFVMSVYWISTVAGELLNCLAALGVLLGVPPSLLGLTVLAWGNSVGDLVADVAVAKAGQPAMAMAGCFAGPMFNMLVGLGTALVMQTANIYPKAYELQFHIGIIVAFVFLLSSLMGSLLVITWSRFRVPRFWGFCLVGLYVFFMVVSLLIGMIA